MMFNRLSKKFFIKITIQGFEVYFTIQASFTLPRRKMFTASVYILEAGKGRIKNGRQGKHLPATPALMDS